MPLGRLAGIRWVAICLPVRNAGLQSLPVASPVTVLALTASVLLGKGVDNSGTHSLTHSLTYPLSPGGGVSCSGSPPSILVIQGPLQVCLSI